MLVLGSIIFGMIHLSDAYFMCEALKEAGKAYAMKEVPIGAVVVSGKHIIARAHNQVEQLQDATAHAEILALTAASNYWGSKYLRDCTLYVTLEPCCMCAGATYWAQLGRLVFGASDLRRGYRTMGSQLLHPRTQVTGAVRNAESTQLVKRFFLELRT